MKSVHLTRRGFLSVLAAGASASLFACAKQPSSTETENTRTFFCFDTVCTVSGGVSKELLDEVEELCEHFEQLFSRTIDTSDISRINQARGEATEVDVATAELIELSLVYSEESGGLFDITIGCVSALWDFKGGVVPADEEIAAALPHIGYENVVVDGVSVTLLDPDAKLDLGGIAKGYIADRLAELLTERGVEHAFINLGGNVYVLGGKPDGSLWRVGIQDPDTIRGESIVATVELETGSVVTSGLYERSFEWDGVTYSHILDPRTGYPVESDIVSATVVSERSIDGDGYTKPLFMMDEEEALKFVASKEGCEALLIRGDGTSVTTSGSSFLLT